MDEKIKGPTLKEILVVSILLMLVINVFKSWAKLNDRLQFIRNAKIELAEEQKKQENLKREFAKTQTEEFIEKQAREKLNMSREGELIILLPTPILSLSPTPTPIDSATNVEKWARLFL